jgi:hypothetical protein
LLRPTPASRIAKKDPQAGAAGNVKRWSIDGKATGQRGEFSRGGLTRGEVKACAHDLGCPAKYLPCGVGEEDTGQLSITFGSSAKTSDFIVEALAARWQALPADAQRAPEQLQLKMDIGPESSGVRTQVLPRMVQFADAIGNPLPLLDYPPYHSKYNPIARGWGSLELHCNGTLLRDGETRLAWAHSMTWKGRSPVGELSHKEYPRGITLRQKALLAVERRLERHPELPKWDIFIHPPAPD